jgi:alkanesulfonate monooxygenase SsuD/methylene tetrahydromethanopterin reductase-like flavin-dependent oxidoreductase (luciferase family)
LAGRWSGAFKKPIQKPRIPIYLGGFSLNTFSRIAKYADGWLAAAAGSLEYLANGIKTLQGEESRIDISIITLTFPQITTKSQKENGAKKAPFSGTIDEVGDNLRNMKEMGVDHVIFGLIDPDLGQVISNTKQLSKFAK